MYEDGSREAQMCCMALCHVTCLATPSSQACAKRLLSRRVSAGASSFVSDAEPEVTVKTFLDAYKVCAGMISVWDVYMCVYFCWEGNGAACAGMPW